MISIFTTIERINTIIAGRVIYFLRKYLDNRDDPQEYRLVLRRNLTDNRLVNMALELINTDRYGLVDEERSTLEHLAELILDDINFIGYLRGEILKLAPSEVWLIEKLKLSLDCFRESHSVCPYTRNIYGVD